MIEGQNISSSISPALARMLSEMDQAITDEIQKLSAFKPIKHSAVDGRLLAEGNGQYIYQFTLTEPWEPQDDGQLSIANECARGITCSVVTSVGTTLTIACEKPLPPEVLRQIDLYDDTTELLKRLKDALKHVDEGAALAGSKSFGLVGSAKQSYPGEIQCGPMLLRDKQMHAARLALGGEVTFIVGPPGTGKTSTLATIALTHLQAGRTVLIASHTNIAIDNAIMKLCDLCKGADRADLLAQGQVVRYGAVQKEELKKDDRYAEVYLPKIARSLGSELHAQHEQLKAALADLDVQMSVLQQKEPAREESQQAEYHRAQIDRLQRELDPLEKAEARRISHLHQQQSQYQATLAQLENDEKHWSYELARTEAMIVEQEQALVREQQSKQRILTQLVEARAMSGIKRFLKGIKLENLELKVAGAAQAVEGHEQSLQGLKKYRSDIFQHLKGYQQQRQSAEAALSDIQRAFHTPTQETQKISLLREQLQTHKQGLARIEALLKQKTQRYQQDYNQFIAKRSQIEAQMADIDKRLRDMEKGIVENARVVGTTLTKTYMNQTMAGKRFDAVILDEVSMASLPLVYLAAAHADNSVTLIGDPQQLAPIVNAETALAKKWLGTDLFRLRGVSLEAALQGRAQSVMLDVQSRMHPAISIIANKCVYDGMLKDELNENTNPKIAPLPGSSLVLCDTNDASPTVSRPPNGKSRKNYYHALCDLALARQILASVPEMKQRAERCIGIVTPYRPQAQLLQKLIKDEGLQNWIQAGTVHRFQGLEFDAVIFDTVESPGLMPGEFISGSRGSESMRLINVAVTRPKQKLYIVANLAYLRRTLSDQATLRLAVEEAARVAILPSLDTVGTPFSTLLKELRELEPGFDHAQAALSGTLLDRISTDTYKRSVEHDVLVFNPAQTSFPGKQGEGEIQHFTEKTIYAAAKQEIQNARESICIASPYIAKARLNSVIDLLLEQKRRGIHLVIFTKPIKEVKERYHGEAIQEMLSRGLEPICETGIHQKALIIDEQIMYHGSLNFLSHRDTTESILRITNLRIIREVYESLSSQKPPDEDRVQNLEEIRIPLKELSTARKCTCGNPLIPKLRNDGSGVFFGCSQYSTTKDKSSENVSSTHLQQIMSLQNQICRGCGSPMTFSIYDRPQRILLVCEANCGEMQKITFFR